MKEFKWFEDLTDSITVSVLVGVALAALSQLFQIGTFIPFALQAIGLFVMGSSLWKWWKHRARKKSDHKKYLSGHVFDSDIEETDEVYSYAVWKRPSEVYIKRMLVGISIVAIVSLVIFTTYKVREKQEKDQRYKYQACLNECYDNITTKTQEDLCKRSCISKYR